MSQRDLSHRMFQAAIAAADPRLVLPPAMPPRPAGRAIVVGAGKAAALMAQTVERAWGGPLEGLVVTRYGHGAPCERIEVVEAAHPTPDAAGRDAARRILAMMSGLSEQDSVLCLISGGGSSLLALPAEGLTLEDKQAVNAALLKSGAPISQMNAVRKHLSAIKGGRLAAAAFPARMTTLVISDVPGDDPSVVASGPTVADPTTYADLRAILTRWGIAVPPAVTAFLDSHPQETPKPGDPRLARSEVHIVATARAALEAGARVAAEAGYETVILGDDIEGEAREIGRDHARRVIDALAQAGGARRRIAILSGGETTVTVRGRGRGGRNSEYLLAAALALEGRERVAGLAGDTDGIDGSEENAGAFFDAGTLSRARAAGLDPAAALERNDAWSVFAAAGDLVTTGPTLTNVNDFRALLIG